MSTRRPDRDPPDGLAEEIRGHLDEEVARLIAQGMAPAEARRRARLQFGNPQLVLEDTRALWRWRWLDELRQDLRQTLRLVRRAPGFAAVTVLTLALGIGASTTVFSIAHTVLIRPLPFPGSERLVRVIMDLPADQSPTRAPMRMALGVSQAEADAILEQSETLGSVGQRRSGGARAGHLREPLSPRRTACRAGSPA